MEIGNQPGEVNCVQNVRKTLTFWEMLPSIPVGIRVKDFYPESGGVEVQETHLYGMSQRQSEQDRARAMSQSPFSMEPTF